MARRVANSTETTSLPASDNLRLVSNELLLLAAVALAPIAEPKTS